MQVKVPAIILAGGSNSPEMIEATGQTVRALTPLAGQSMLEYIVGALLRSETAGQITVVGDVPSDQRYSVLPPGATLVDNLFSGLGSCGSDGNVLVVTSDIPFITADAIDDFVRLSTAKRAALCYPIISMKLYNGRFSEMKRTTLKLREGTFTGGNAIVVNAGLLLSNRTVISEAYAARKSIFKLGAMLGPALLIRIVLSQLVAPRLLTLAQLEAGVSGLLGSGVAASAIITKYPELGTDVDKPDDVRAAEAILSR